MNNFIVEDHFANLHITICWMPLKNSSMDEKGSRLQLHKDIQEFPKTGSKRIHNAAKEHGQNITTVTCEKATGWVIAFMILFAELKKSSV